jgi:hypothetical protein
LKVADDKTTVANIGETRAMFIDIYTDPDSIYEPMDIEVVMPETFLGSNLLAASVCDLKVVYTGLHTSCIQKDFLNSKKVQYYQNILSFKNDKAVISLDSICNSAQTQSDPLDNLIRLGIFI